jgi:cation transport ATPase
VLVRGGRTLDKLVQAGTVALDKTGTLTTGIMSCVAMDAVQLPGAAAGAAAPSCEYDALTLATALERLAVHPIARAVVAQGVRDNVPRVPVEHFEVRSRPSVRRGPTSSPTRSFAQLRPSIRGAYATAPALCNATPPPVLMKL